ncbi:myosin-2 essential light chain-like [Babylonia areolata]|uniref:myosin-2 essential light chain-like n=1 Tax=Babylonia areolata TaxID=304850 RepID=UPI003FD5486F
MIVVLHSYDAVLNIHIPSGSSTESRRANKMSKYTEDDLNEIQETFSLFDTRGDNKIAASQLGDVLRALHQNPTEQEIRKCGYSQNPDARISFETFFPILQTISKNRSVPPLEDFIEGFRVFDKEQNGFITSAELRHILTSLGEKLNDEEVDQLIQGVEDSQGNINYEELIKMVRNG